MKDAALRNMVETGPLQGRLYNPEGDQMLTANDDDQQRSGVAWALQQSGLTATRKLVLTVLAASCPPSGASVRISNRRIAERASVDRKTVTHAIAELASRGLIAVEPTTAEDGGTLANRYRLLRETALSQPST